jgi:hypothetical protein
LLDEMRGAMLGRYQRNTIVDQWDELYALFQTECSNQQDMIFQPPRRAQADENVVAGELEPVGPRRAAQTLANFAPRIVVTGGNLRCHANESAEVARVDRMPGARLAGIENGPADRRARRIGQGASRNVDLNPLDAGRKAIVVEILIEITASEDQSGAGVRVGRGR